MGSKVPINSIGDTLRSRKKREGREVGEAVGGETMQGKGIVESVVARWCGNHRRRLGNGYEDNLFLKL